MSGSNAGSDHDHSVEQKANKRRYAEELNRFESLLKGGFQVRNPHIEVKAIDEWSVAVSPKAGSRVSLPDGKAIGLTLLGLVHGNELAGIAVINGLLDFLLSMPIELPFPVALVLGNPWAGKEATRFLERDLNRSFGARNGTKLEEKRAGELEKILGSSSFLVDFHQTTEVSDRPFFIFPFQPRGFAFANAIGPHMSTATHWGDPFSAEGMCSDEFVNAKGGCGITMELGQSGFDTYQVGYGIQAGLRAIQVVSEVLSGSESLKMPTQNDFKGSVFTWEAVIPYPKGTDVDLIPGWFNFKAVHEGDLLGYNDGTKILAPASGRILFPKYRKPYDNVRKPTELCRIMREIGIADLPVSAH